MFPYSLFFYSPSGKEIKPSDIIIAQILELNNRLPVHIWSVSEGALKKVGTFL